MNPVTIRFNGDSDDTYYFIKMGPIGGLSPPVREFRGGDPMDVILHQITDKPDVVDLTFSDGATAYEVPREFFTVDE